MNTTIRTRPSSTSVDHGFIIAGRWCPFVFDEIHRSSRSLQFGSFWNFERIRKCQRKNESKAKVIWTF